MSYNNKNNFSGDSLDELQNVYKLCDPIINSYSFNRLSSITFLGILSPKFENKFFIHL